MKIIFICLVCFFFSQYVVAEQALTRVGHAYDNDSDVLLYTEHHHEIFSDNVVAQSKVIYRDDNGEVFAEKNIDFRGNSFLPEFSLLNTANGHMEATRFVDNGYEVEFIEGSNKTTEKKKLDYSSEAISDAGFDNFIITHWQEISSGSKFTRDFLIPGMLRFLQFRIYQEEIVEQPGKKYRVLHIEPANFLLRTFAGTSKLFYEYDRPVLKKFLGVSNMRDEKGDNYKVSIRYEEHIALLTLVDE